MLNFVISPSLKKFLSYVKPYRWSIIAATFCGLLKYNIPIIFPWVFKDVVDRLLSPSSYNIIELHYTMLGLIAVFTFWAVVTYLRSYLADRTSQRLIFDLRHELYVHLQRMSLSFYEKRRVGSVASRLLGDISVAQNFVGAAFTNTVMDASSLFLIAFLLFLMNYKLALVSIAIFPFYVFLNSLFKSRIRKTSLLAREKMEEISGDVHEKLSGISIIQSYTREKSEEKKFFQDNREYLSYQLENVKHNAAAASVIGFLTSIAPVLVVWYGAVQVIHGHLTVGELTAFFAYLGMFYTPLNRLTELNILLANSQSAIERIFEVFNTSPEVVDHPAAREKGPMKGEIEFSNVYFAYELSKIALKDISLRIPANSTVALVGPSGSGKSTFAKLIPRFYDVSAGTITIDGFNIRDLKLSYLRRKIATVPQDPILFSGTIYENIIFGRPNAAKEEVSLAAISANAHNFICKLSKGYQTEIGEDGLKLSGGQRQRVALARAFLKNAPILILDEATSSLDSEAENLIQQALKRLMQNRTTIIIAHRLSTIQSADIIVVFDGGRIVEVGSHQELLESYGLYHRLHEEQFHKMLMESVG
ncbi:MAG: Lipid A export ATP-binding/permease protein MsbA [Candidatus Jettenia ecosi]|uniref:Lipid A export ATP-binding/permease protein MsbA n=1 Tax=Candidatus Jettenia ecosi TaxID=2494326 RepID=A0A533QC13_9BACT|nr:MAG: Lipid A export ATP-binding/permease protein MsbA [Candidatus Jettenia ecosi]